MPEAGYVLAQSPRLTQTIAPQMREALRLLELPAADLAAELRQQMAHNPLIEDVRESMEAPLSAVAPGARAETSAADANQPLDFTPGGEAAERILGAQDGNLDYFMSNNLESAAYEDDETARSRRQHLFDSCVGAETLQNHLLAQIPTSDLSEKDRVLAEALIGDVDDDGFWKGSMPDVQMIHGVDEKKVVAVLRHVLKFDPAGCGARNLRECLLAQMDKLDDSPWQNEVRRIVAHHLDDVAAGRAARVREELNLSPEEYEEALKALRTLDPRPGRKFAGSARAQYVRPEIRAVNVDGRWTAVVDDRALPRVRLSKRYLEILSDPRATAETKAWVREKLRAAEAVVEAVERRQETIRAIAQEIMDAQLDFFVGGRAALRPLTMQTVADRVGVHATTVSRTVNAKYISTPKGVVALRDFFVQGVGTGENGQVSNAAVQARIRALVEAEDPAHPLSDEALAARLKTEGMKVARRTVAKYREELAIPAASRRRLPKT